MSKTKTSRVWKPDFTAYQFAAAEELVSAIKREALAMKALRTSLGLSQAEVARMLGVTQSSISKLESNDDPKLSSIRKLVEAKGGHLRLTAEFGDREIELLV